MQIKINAIFAYQTNKDYRQQLVLSASGETGRAHVPKAVGVGGPAGWCPASTPVPVCPGLSRCHGVLPYTRRGEQTASQRNVAGLLYVHPVD